MDKEISELFGSKSFRIVEDETNYNTEMDKSEEICRTNRRSLENCDMRLDSSMESSNLERNFSHSRSDENRYNCNKGTIKHHPRNSIYYSNNWVIKLGNIHRDVEEEELKEFLKPFKFLKLVLRKDVSSMFALVEVELYEEACEMFIHLDGKKFMGNKLEVQFDRSSISRNQNWHKHSSNKRPQRFERNTRFYKWPIPERVFNGDLVQKSDLRAFNANTIENKISKALDMSFLLNKINQNNECPAPNLVSICMEPLLVQQIFSGTSLPTFDEKLLPSVLDLAIFEEPSNGFMWAVVMNRGIWANELVELTHMLNELDEQSLCPAVKDTIKVGKKYDGMWNRAWVVKRVEEKVTLFYLDFGTVEEVSRSELFCLPNQFWRFRPMALPFYCKDYSLPSDDDKVKIVSMKFNGKYNDYIFSVEMIKK